MNKWHVYRHVCNKGWVIHGKLAKNSQQEHEYMHGFSLKLNEAIRMIRQIEVIWPILSKSQDPQNI